jgi:hypothetical protein
MLITNRLLELLVSLINTLLSDGLAIIDTIDIKTPSNSFRPYRMCYFKGKLQLELRWYSDPYTDYNFSYNLCKLIKAIKTFKDNNI